MKKYLISFFLFSCFALGSAQEDENILRNAQFDDGRRSWRVSDEGEADSQYLINSDGLLSGPNCLQIDIQEGGSRTEDVGLRQGIQVDMGLYYSVSFMAKSGEPHTMTPVFRASSGEKEELWRGPTVEIDPTARHFGPFRTGARLPDTGCLFYLFTGGKDNVTVYVDSVVITTSVDTSYIAPEDKFEKRRHTYGGTSLPYRLCPPDEYDPLQKYPLVLALHGAGERGNDNEIHIAVHRMATAWADSANQANYPCFVVAPQCPVNNRWVDSDWSSGTYRVSETPESNEMQTVNDLLDSLVREFSVDTDRLYITGLSMGGYGTWDMISRYPNRFAAAIPMSGGGDTTQARTIRHIPIWAFHGEKDNVVPPSGSRDMIRAVENTGIPALYTHCKYGDCTGLPPDYIDEKIDQNVHLLYTEYEGKGHVMWAESYDNPRLIRWVFSKDRSKPTGLAGENPVADRFTLLQNYPNPFNPETNIEYSLKAPGHVNIEVFNMLGRTVAVLVDRVQQPGVYRVPFLANNLPSGVYYYRLTAGRYTAGKKMMLLR